jgi:hypothetical protein
MRTLLILGLLLLPHTAEAGGKAARYYVKVRNVIEAPGVTSDYAEQSKKLLIEELKKHPAFTLEWPGDLPEEEDALVLALRKRKIRAFEVTLKIMT